MAGGVLSLSIAKTAAEKWSDFFFYFFVQKNTSCEGFFN